MGNSFVLREFFCNKDEVKIYTREYLPEGADLESGKYQAMILCHGFGDDCDGIKRECEHFASIGYAVYSFDFCGGSAPDRGGRSDGTDIDMTIRSETEDLLTVFEYVKSLSYTDNDHITFMGFSQGGFISNLAAAKCPDEVENLVLVFPALCIPDHARLGCLGGGHYDPNVTPEKIECPNGMTLGKQFFYQASYLDPFKEMAAYKGRVLIVHGMEDPVVNYSYSIKASKSFSSAKECHLVLIRNAGHGFDEEKTESLYIATEHFLTYRKELLTIQVFVTGLQEVPSDNDESPEGELIKKQEVYFTGYCDNEIFKGSINPEGVDTQRIYKDGSVVLHADYSLVGIDKDNNKASLHVINEKKGDRFKPVIDTDNNNLLFLNKTDLTAAIEGFNGGLTVRIWG